jgi:CRISPR/Cas system-associated exonuclease Cas4 (RecB family)
MQFSKKYLILCLVLINIFPIESGKRKKRTHSEAFPEKIDLIKISRSKLSLFLNCPRCFFLNYKNKIKQPDGFPFTLNNAVDELLKKEFDYYRLKQEPHPNFKENNIKAVPFKHAKIDEWRDSLHKGIRYQIPETNIEIFGGIDDVWINTETGNLMIVDYKATSKKGEVSLDADWQINYKRQVEIYQWLFRKNGFNVSNTAYFVYTNARKDVDRFDNQLKFKTSFIPYEGNASWIDNTIDDIRQCLGSNNIPEHGENCKYCKYSMAISALNKKDSKSIGIQTD